MEASYARTQSQTNKAWLFNPYNEQCWWTPLSPRSFCPKFKTNQFTWLQIHIMFYYMFICKNWLHFEDPSNRFLSVILIGAAVAAQHATSQGYVKASWISLEAYIVVLEHLSFIYKLHVCTRKICRRSIFKTKDTSLSTEQNLLDYSWSRNYRRWGYCMELNWSQMFC